MRQGSILDLAMALMGLILSLMEWPYQENLTTPILMKDAKSLLMLVRLMSEQNNILNKKF